jgi:hypothetical protein
VLALSKTQLAAYVSEDHTTSFISVEVRKARKYLVYVGVRSWKLARDENGKVGAIFYHCVLSYCLGDEKFVRVSKELLWDLNPCYFSRVSKFWTSTHNILYMY